MSRSKGKLIILNTPSPRAKDQFKKPHSSSSSKCDSEVTAFTTITSLNLSQMNKEQKLLRFTRNVDLDEYSQQQLGKCLEQKEQMLRFYKKEEARRKERFFKDKGHRETVLSETLKNINNLLELEMLRNRQLETKIFELKQKQARESAANGYRLSCGSMASEYLPSQMMGQLGDLSELNLLDSSKIHEAENHNLALDQKGYFGLFTEEGSSRNLSKDDTLLLEDSMTSMGGNSSVLTLAKYIQPLESQKSINF